MKKLIADMAIGFTLGFSALSSASDYMDLYTNGPAVNEVKSETNGEEVETSPMSFYLSPVKVHVNNDTLRTSEETESDDNTLLVVGVRIQQCVKGAGSLIQIRLPPSFSGKK
ncbi:MAG: hypothetical protein ACHQ6U_06845 [Thermodesulfobacteriota bacterium]